MQSFGPQVKLKEGMQHINRENLQERTNLDLARTRRSSSWLTARLDASLHVGTLSRQQEPKTIECQMAGDILCDWCLQLQAGCFIYDIT